MEVLAAVATAPKGERVSLRVSPAHERQMQEAANQVAGGNLSLFLAYAGLREAMRLAKTQNAAG